MKIIINKKILLDNIKICNSIIETIHSSPIFLGLQIQVFEDNIKITSTNGTISINSSINKSNECVILKQGVVLVKSKTFFSIIQKLKNEDITLEKVDNSVLKIKTKSFDMNINIMDDEQYPLINFSYNNWNEIDLPSIVLKKVLSKIKQSVNLVKEKPSIFSGVCFISDNKKGTLEIIGTDTFKLSYYCFKHKNNDFKFVLDAQLIEIFSDLLNSNTTIKFFISESNLIIKINHILISSKLIDGEYPNVNGIINSPKTNKFIISKKEMIEALERGLIVSSSEKKPIAKMVFENNEIKLSFKSIDVGNSEETLLCTSMNNENNMTICFNASYMLTLLKTFDNDIINIYTSTESKPIILEDEKEPNFIQLLVPIKNF